MKPLNIAMGLLIGFAVMVAIGSCEYPDLVQIEAHKQETIAAAKIEAHKRAVRLREAGLLEQSNQLMAPCCQMTEK